MVSTATTVQEDDPPSPSRTSTRFRGYRMIPLGTCGIVAALAQLPVLRDRWFYFTDDTATQILPMWFHLGERVRAGEWPPLLDLDSWMGGNLAVEALFGVWNPVNAAVWVLVSVLPDLALAGILIRTVAFVAVAFGCYGLCREYGAARWAASAVSVAIPFCGPLFYFDAAKWPAALLAFVWVPYLWWAVRRMTRDRLNAVWVFGIGVLAVTSGNPYAMLGVCVVLVGVLAETAMLKPLCAARRVLLVSLTIASFVPLVYLPLLLSSNVTWRTTTPVGNSGVLAPGLSDLVNLSFPSYVPEIPGVGDPAVYFCWFALPLAAWLDWSVLRARRRELTACLVTAGTFLLFAIGPAELWMFRWPLRVLHYGYVAVAVVLAVLLSAGLRTDRARRRVFGTGVLVGFSCYVVWAAAPAPEFAARNLVSLLVIGALTAAAVLVRTHGLAVVLHLGTVLTFGLQVCWFLGSHGTMPYYFPTNVEQARSHFEHRYVGRTFQVADPGLIGPPDRDREAWRDFVPGNLYLPAGVDSVNAYTGMGMAAFADRLCFSYHGSTGPGAYSALWRKLGGTNVPLADLLRLDTVTVQRKLIDAPRVPDGWRVRERDDRVTVLRRQSSKTSYDGRLSWASPGVRVSSNAAPDDRHETVRFHRADGPARLVFARLAWPGYIAKVGNVRVPAYAGPAGLLEIRLPPGVEQGRLRISWTPPRLKAELALAAAGLIGALALGAAQYRRGAAR